MEESIGGIINKLDIHTNKNICSSFHMLGNILPSVNLCLSFQASQEISLLLLSC